MKKFFILAVIAVFTANFFPKNIFANPDLYDITGTAVMLIERSTGRVLYERNPDMLIYPASMIKVLTAIVMLDYIGLDEIVVVGEEINYVPFGSSRVGHILGEHITGHTLLRGLILPSGNDTANVVAMNVATRIAGTPLPFEEAELLFTQLMNERAREIGLTSSNFTNAHGFHDPDMQVTARDLITLAGYAIDIPIIRETAGELQFSDYTVPYTVEGWENMQTRSVLWNNTNRMLVGIFYHPDVTGLKTGFHTPAGHTFLGTAERDGTELISVIGGSYSETRFLDTARLFNYAFDNYDFLNIHTGLNPIHRIDISNPRWGDESSVYIFGTTNFSHFMTQDEMSSIQRDLVFFDDFLHLTYPYEEDIERPLSFLAPLYAGDVIGRVVFTLNGEEIFYDNLVITENIIAWSYSESFRYIFSHLVEDPFSILGLSIILAIIFICIIVSWIISITRKILKRSNRLRRMQRTKFKL